MDKLLQQNKHLLWRTGFGPALSQFSTMSRISPGQMYDMVAARSADAAKPLSVVLDGISGDNPALRLSSDDKKKQVLKNREHLKALNLLWLREMVDSPAQLREKLSFFWHGHFACRSVVAEYQQVLINDIRRHALGKFGDLLKVVSRSAAMINFLNNNQNRKTHPNENFARELMELFTLGRGNYTEQDVKEAARAFTGWGADLNGNFTFRPRQHDAGSKTFLGRTGNFTGDDILNILLEERQTARFIVGKIYRFFVCDKVNEHRVVKLADDFYDSGYNIQLLLNRIFKSGWFYDVENRGEKIKSPVELLAGIQRALPMQVENPDALLALQKIMGQVLFLPPNVAGWPGGNNWIDSSTLMIRMRLPLLIRDSGSIDLEPKTDDDLMMGGSIQGALTPPKNNRPPALKKQSLQAVVNWASLFDFLSRTPKDQLVSSLSSLLLAGGEKVPETVIRKHADISNRKQFIQSVALYLMALPDYQVC